MVLCCGRRTRAINDTTKDPKNISMWLTSGIPFLLSKGKGTKKPKHYHPITWLSTIHKILTAALTNRIYNHLLRHNYFSEQKVCHRMLRGCTDQLLVSKMITSLVKKHQRHLGMAWIYYKKVSDRLPHTWIVTVMEKYNYKTICGGIEERTEDWNLALLHQRACQNRKIGY
jgi:hypothetical protein